MPDTLIPLLRKTRVVGTSYRTPFEQAVAARLSIGDKLVLAFEDTNPNDSLAVQVVVPAGTPAIAAAAAVCGVPAAVANDAIHIGYLAAEMSATLYALDALKALDTHSAKTTVVETGKGKVFVDVALVEDPA